MHTLTLWGLTYARDRFSKPWPDCEGDDCKGGQFAMPVVVVEENDLRYPVCDDCLDRMIGRLK